MDQPSEGMTSNRPYLLRALREWITDNGLTPQILVDATLPGVDVPPGVEHDGKVVLNISDQAVAGLEISDDWALFNTRFSGRDYPVTVPIAAVMAIYARENGQGMMFADGDLEPPDGGGPSGDDPADPPETPTGRSHLKVIK